MRISELSAQLKEAGSKIVEQKAVLSAIDAKAGNRDEQIAPLIAEAEKVNKVIEQKMADDNDRDVRFYATSALTSAQ